MPGTRGSSWKIPPAIILRGFALVLAAHAPAGLASDGTPASADPVRGETIYATQCTGCHAVDKTLIGPKHCGVFGRRAGSVPGYAYSEAMKEADFSWDAQHLDDFLKSPIVYLNGTNMGFIGLDNAQDRADVIAFLRKGMNPAACAETSKVLAAQIAANAKRASPGRLALQASPQAATQASPKGAETKKASS